MTRGFQDERAFKFSPQAYKWAVAALALRQERAHLEALYYVSCAHLRHLRLLLLHGYTKSLSLSLSLSLYGSMATWPRPVSKFLS